MSHPNPKEAKKEVPRRASPPALRDPTPPRVQFDEETIKRHREEALERKAAVVLKPAVAEAPRTTDAVNPRRSVSPESPEKGKPKGKGKGKKGKSRSSCGV